MPTATISANLMQRLAREEAAAQLEARAEALADLAAVQADLQSTIPALDTKVREARAAFETVKTEADKRLKAADAKVRAAQQARTNADYQLSQRRDRLQSRLAGELAHPAIVEALSEVETIRNDYRHPAQDVAPKFAGSVTTWCISAAGELADLMLSADGDLELQISAIMASRPN